MAPIHDDGMMQVATVGSKGQVVIPHKIREKFGIDAGDQIVFLSKDDHILTLIKIENMQQMVGQLQEFLDQSTGS